MALKLKTLGVGNQAVDFHALGMGGHKNHVTIGQLHHGHGAVEQEVVQADGGPDSLPALDFTVSIDHRYPIADDEDAERTLDLQEVSQQARSRKCYMRKWHPNEDSDSELAQIVSEQKMLDDGFEDGIRAEMVESKLE